MTNNSKNRRSLSSTKDWEHSLVGTSFWQTDLIARAISYSLMAFLKPSKALVFLCNNGIARAYSTKEAHLDLGTRGKELNFLVFQVCGAFSK